jgi:uncharacterized membrane protein YphA (DoxX/SURF4 family)
LLLLRIALGVAAVFQARLFLAGSIDPTLAAWAVGLAVAAGAVCLVAGLFTPIVSVLVGLSGIGAAVSYLPGPLVNRIETWMGAAFVLIVSVAIAFLGPGAFSLDSHLFGRREIVIPPSPRPPRP